MLLSCNEFQWFCVVCFAHQARPASRDCKSARLSHTSPKCCYGRVTASVFWKLMGRETLHTHGFPRRLRAGDTILMLLVRLGLAYGMPCRIAKRYVCAVKSCAALLSVFVALLCRMPRIASCCGNVSKYKLKPFEPLCLWSTQIIARPSGPVPCHQTQPTYVFLRFLYVLTKCYENQQNINTFVAKSATPGFSARQTCVGVGAGDHAFW